MQTQELQFRPINRGIKLRINSTLGKPTIIPTEEETEFVTFGRRRAIVKKRMKREEDPYSLVRIEEIWKIPETIEDLQTETIKNAFRSRHTQLLSAELMKIVEEIHPFYVVLLQLLSLMEEDCGVENNVKVELQSKALVFSINQELSFIVNEYMERIHDIRRLLIKAHLQKRELAMKLGI